MSVYEKHFNQALLFIHDHQELVDCHLVDFITENLWEKHIPLALRLDLESTEKDSEEKLSKNVFLTKFITETDNLALKNNNHVLKLTDIPSFFHGINNPEDLPEKINFPGFLMKEKKSYEVKELSRALGHLLKSKTNVIIDVGAGKGYLAANLSQNYEIPVLAVDSSECRHRSAIRRQEFLKKKKHQSFPLVESSVKFIDDNTDFKQLLQSSFPSREVENALITGLHTCGSLAHAMIRGFLRSDCLETLCAVSCCYHLTDESLTGRCNLSKNARMLAQQSVERGSTRSGPSTLFYRAVLQVLLQSLGVPDARVGRGAPTGDFIDYAKWALGKIGLSAEIPADYELQQLYEAHADFQWRLEAFQSLRVRLGSVVEAVVILDRAIYLEQSDKCSKVAVVRLFDPVLSPRCFAIVARK